MLSCFVITLLRLKLSVLISSILVLSSTLNISAIAPSNALNSPSLVTLPFASYVFFQFTNVSAGSSVGIVIPVESFVTCFFNVSQITSDFKISSLPSMIGLILRFVVSTVPPPNTDFNAFNKLAVSLLFIHLSLSILVGLACNSVGTKIVGLSSFAMSSIFLIIVSLITTDSVILSISLLLMLVIKSVENSNVSEPKSLPANITVIALKILNNSP